MSCEHAGPTLSQNLLKNFSWKAAWLVRARSGLVAKVRTTSGVEIG